MTKDEIMQKINVLEYRLFLTDMIDNWDDEDKETYAKLKTEIKNLKKQLNELNKPTKENHTIPII